MKEVRSQFNITIIGTGYVGLVTGVCLAELRNQVVCYDIDAQKVRKFKKGQVPFYEPGLADLLKKNKANGRLKFTLNFEEAMAGSSIIFICVGTPPRVDGSADLRVYFKVVRDMGRFLKRRDFKSLIIVNKSTVPIGTAREADQIIKKIAPKANFTIASNPEFLREGVAVNDFMHPERIVLGFEKTQSSKLKVQSHNLKLKTLLDLYGSFSCPKVVTDWETAEMVKYAANAFLATKISFINEIANVCDKVRADVNKVAEGMGYDKRIGQKFLQAGIGYGGSCFPKDVRALHHISLHQDYNFKLLKAVIEVNNQQRLIAIKKIKQALGGQLKNRLIAVLGLTFKPETDDTRESVGIFIIKELIKQGVVVKAYDPKASENARWDLAGVRNAQNVKIAKTALSAIINTDLVFLAAEWQEFLDLDWQEVKKAMRGDVVVDGRNALDSVKVREAGLRYVGFGV